MPLNEPKEPSKFDPVNTPYEIDLNIEAAIAEYQFSPSEVEVIQQVLNMNTSAHAISEDLGNKPRTIVNQLVSIYKKMGIGGGAEHKMTLMVSTLREKGLLISRKTTRSAE